MKKIIHKLRNRSEEERRHILHIVIFILALFMILLWTFSLGRSIGSPETKIKINQDLKPLSVLKDNLVGGINSMQGSGSSNTNTSNTSTQ